MCSHFLFYVKNEKKYVTKSNLRVINGSVQEVEKTSDKIVGTIKAVSFERNKYNEEPCPAQNPKSPVRPKEGHC